jgi:protein arginine kinase activator
MSEHEEKDPTTCERCGKEPATVHVRRVAEGEEEIFHLCVSCAREQGVEAGAGGTVEFNADPVSILFKSLGEVKGTEGACPGCGMTYTEFRDTGRLGCARCYKTFAGELEPLLRRLHGSTKHAGKRPTREGESYERAAQLRRLNEELERAVGAEDYERAAELRDRIRDMETVGGAGERRGA